MKAVKSTSVVDYVNGPTAVWMKGEKTPMERTFTGWVEGISEEVRMYPMLWIELVEDNNPLRAMINGRITGVPEDFMFF